MQITTYLYFNGRCEEAIEFYKQALGAKVENLLRFKQAPQGFQPTPGQEEKVMHAHLKICDTDVFASDGRCSDEMKFDGFALSILVESEAEADKTFAAVSEGGQVLMPLAKTFFSPKFGMAADKFGVMWMVLVRTG